MKRFAPVLLAWFLLLTVTGSCKKDPVEEPAPAVNVEEPEPNLANCRIVKETYQVGWRPEATATKETVQVDGKSYDVMFARESTFSYDTQGRIVKEAHKLAPYFTPGIDYTITYAYTPAAVYRRTLLEKGDQTDTIRLNERGLVELDIEGMFRYYDSEGYVKNGVSKSGRRKTEWTRDTLKNVVRFQDFDPNEPRTYTYEYDRSRKALPNRTPHYGKESPNLRTKFTFAVDGSSFFPRGVLFTIDYRQTFDKHERVSRQIAIETHLVPDQQYGQYIYAGGIGVTDYQYKCP